MTKKQLVLLVAVALVGIYLIFFTDWFASEGIQITHAIRAPSAAKRPRPGALYLGHAVSPIVFTLNRKCRLTELQVFNASELATNKYAHPVWHLVSKSASAPIKGFVYGGYIRGMSAKIPGADADPLEADVAYRLLLQVGNLKVEHDFKGPPARNVRR